MLASFAQHSNYSKPFHSCSLRHLLKWIKSQIRLLFPAYLAIWQLLT